MHQLLIIAAAEATPAPSDWPAWIAAFSAVVTTLASLVLAWMTYSYVKLTSKMVDHMGAARLPFVDVQILLRSRGVFVAVANSGGTAARRISFRVLRDAKIIRRLPAGVGISGLAVIERGVTYLPAGVTLQYEAGQVSYDDLIGPEGRFLDIEVTYRDDSERLYQRNVFYDLAQFDGVSYSSFSDGNYQVAQAIRSVGDRIQTRRSSERRFFFGSKSCKHCGSTIASGASKCSHCHEWQTPRTSPKKTVLRGPHKRPQGNRSDPMATIGRKRRI